MAITIDMAPAAIAKISEIKQAQDRIYLDFEDGVGPFSTTAISCRLDISFRLILVPADYPEEGLSIYDTKLETAVGTVWLKQGAAMYLEEQTRLVVDPAYQRLQLTADSGLLASNVQLLRMDKPVAGS
ncbi:iron-sulfur cluster biosynthesis family protein [Enterococcus sp.]|uniref:iron-sulfur cluster biosynthesis family protein n=1 Tax=Enterococcus sp. TaxID=35783 RepID=UPI0025C28FB0|nr:iron-sulfur cluster biosynthesis family protein [Enterococcus sp.]